MYEDIKQQLAQVISYSQNISNPEVDEIIDRWEKAKADFINMFDGLRWKAPKPVRFELDEETKRTRLNQFISEIFDEFGEDKCFCDLCDFIISMKDCFYDNLTDHEYIYGDKIIKKGSKILKDFKYFISEERDLVYLQDRASQLIQSNCVQGDFYLSVHPLDYLSSSENTHKWRSCHSLDGEHRSGNMSYMLDTSTVVCYICSEKDCKLPHFPEEVPWNSKKWRMLLFFSNDREMLFAGRQYPFAVEAGLKLTTDALAQIDNYHTYTNWYDKYITYFTLDDNEENRVYFDEYDKYIPIGRGLVNICDIITDHEDDLHFNDILYSSCYIPSYCYRLHSTYPWYKRSCATGHTDLHYTKFQIGAIVPCLECGARHIENGETFLCESCRDHYITRCDECGECIYRETEIYEFDGVVMCYDCYCEKVSICPNCGQKYWTDTVHVCSEDESYEKEIEE